MDLSALLADMEEVQRRTDGEGGVVTEEAVLRPFGGSSSLSPTTLFDPPLTAPRRRRPVRARRSAMT